MAMFSIIRNDIYIFRIVQVNYFFNFNFCIMKKFKYFFLFCLIEVCFLPDIFSQENFEQGYVLAQNGDTLNGQIDNRNKWQTPDSIRFINNLKTGVEIFTPRTASGFFVKGDKYISAEIRNDLLHRGQPADNESIPVYAKVFLLVLIEGEKNLYSYWDADNKTYYFIKTDRGYEWLEYREYIAVKEQDAEATGDEKYVKKESKYIGQLILYFQDCPKIQNYLNTTTYDTKSLTHLYSRYYKYCSSDPAYLKTRAKIKTRFGVQGGVSFTKLDFTEVSEFHNLKHTVNADYPMDIKPAAGIFCEFVLPRNNGKWSFLTELLYTSFKTSGTTTTYMTPEYYRVYTSEFDYSYIGLNAMIRFSYPIGQIKLFLNGGFRYNFQISGENSMTEVDYLYENVVTMPTKEALETLNHEYGFLGGMGLRFKKLSLEGRCNLSLGFTNYVDFESHIKQINVLLGYRIF
jgi:hypothetical protein